MLRTGALFHEAIVPSALFVMGLSAGGMFLIDLVWMKVHRRPSTGLAFDCDDPSWPRTFTKLCGFAGSLAFCALIYWLFPEYHGDFYGRYFEMLDIIMPFWLVTALPYFYLIDRHMQQPRDGYWHMGMAFALRWREVDGRVIRQHLLGWLIKAFFLPLMFTYLCADLEKFLNFSLADLTAPNRLFDFLYGLCYLVDVGFASVGYIASLRIADTHFRSAEPTMLGWVVAMSCYEPFASLVSRQYLAYETGPHWGDWFSNAPVAFALWGASIIVLTAVYAWATVIFGVRFSNLTHRGIVTNGPYRWTKHPAYLAKNLSWWMISMPFMAQGSVEESARLCLLLLLLNGIYMLRAKTEERHLSRDPDYVAYALYVEQHGRFRFIQRLLSRQRSGLPKFRR